MRRSPPRGRRRGARGPAPRRARRGRGDRRRAGSARRPPNSGRPTPSCPAHAASTRRPNASTASTSTPAVASARPRTAPVARAARIASCADTDRPCSYTAPSIAGSTTAERGDHDLRRDLRPEGRGAPPHVPVEDTRGRARRRPRPRGRDHHPIVATASHASRRRRAGWPAARRAAASRRRHEEVGGDRVVVHGPHLGPCVRSDQGRGAARRAQRRVDEQEVPARPPRRPRRPPRRTPARRRTTTTPGRPLTQATSNCTPWRSSPPGEVDQEPGDPLRTDDRSPGRVDVRPAVAREHRRRAEHRDDGVEVAAHHRTDERRGDGQLLAAARRG